MYIKRNKPIKGLASGFTCSTLRVCSDDRFNPSYHLFLMYEHYTLSISTRVDGTVLNGLTSFVGHYHFYWPNTEGSRTSTFANAAVYFRVPDVIFGSTPSSFMYCFTHCRHSSLEADRRPKVAESLFNFTIVETAWEPLESSSRKLLEARFHSWKQVGNR